jgi:hypothetical protein
MLAPVTDELTLFEPSSFYVEKFSLGLRGAGSLAITDDIAAAMKASDGTEEVLSLTVFVTTKGYTKTGNEVTYNAQVVDVTLAD